jgi:hypothetical protein
MFVCLDQVSGLHSSKILDLIRKKPVLRIRIQDQVTFGPLDPGPEMGKKSGSGSGIRSRDEQPESYFLELRNHFLGYILKLFDADPGSGIEKNRIWDGKKSDPGSGINIPNPQLCKKTCLFLVCYFHHTLVGLLLDSRKIQRTISPSESTGSSATAST